MDFVTHNGSTLTMNPAAMEEMGLTRGQVVTEQQFVECLRANARAFCRDMDVRRSRGEAVPDTTRLAQMAGHTGTQ